ncbi:hypothetical protein PIB30_025151 [Stylosanthes scabra]|uniref:Uncharacterized protein n=1 Tax=Stylosanthes scabra TaxID=79078 RepID=A0ABU6X8C5_9FABA|nr:hypothetical protein [Stylosanthes scabra]
MRHKAETMNSIVVHNNNLARVNFYFVSSFNQIKSASFRSKNNSNRCFSSHNQRPKSKRVLNNNKLVLCVNDSENERSVPLCADRTEAVAGVERLHVLEHGLSRRGVTDMTDGEGAGELVELGLVEHVGDEAGTGDGLKDLIVDGYDPDAILAAVLEGVECEVAEA